MGRDLEPSAGDPARPRTPPSLLSTTAAAWALSIPAARLSGWARAGVVRPVECTPGGHCWWDLDDLRRQLVEYDTRSGR